MPFDLIMQNNASKQKFVITGLVDTSETPLAYIFEDFSMPEKAPEGEYSCVLFRNGRNDVWYELSDVLLDTIAHTDEGDVQVRFLRPEIFLLKYGEVKDPYKFRTTDKSYIYRKK